MIVATKGPPEKNDELAWEGHHGVLQRMLFFFPTVMLPLFGLILRPTIGACRRVNDQLIDPLQRRFEVVRGAELSIRHHLERHERIGYNGREFMEVLIGLGPYHSELRPQHIEGGIGLVIIEDKQELLGHGWPFAFGATARFAPASP